MRWGGNIQFWIYIYSEIKFITTSSITTEIIILSDISLLIIKYYLLGPYLIIKLLFIIISIMN